MIQFPTPFRLATKKNTTEYGGNGQLPTHATSGFMVTPALLQKFRTLLQNYSPKKNKDDNDGPYLLLQSNCEDVLAVAMRDMALEIGGMECVEARFLTVSPGDDDFTTPPPSFDDKNINNRGLPTKRTLAWIEVGGERPIGPEWSAEAFLPRYGRSETEVACEFHGTPVHRCLLRVKQEREDKYKQY
jgi:hypothetical protein